MKKFTFLLKTSLLLLVFSFAASQVQAAKTIKTNEDSRSELQLLSKSDLHLTLLNKVGLINSEFINLEGKDYVKLVVPAYTKSTVYGNPEMPVRRRLIEIPYGAVPTVRIVNYEVTEYKLADYGISEQIMPLQYSVPKCGDAPEFVCNNEIYTVDAYMKQELVSVDVLGIMRGTRIARVNISPVFYNPVKNTIRVYENLEFEIVFEGADLVLTQAQKEKYYSPYFSSLLSSLENYSAPANRGDNFTRYPIKYVIVSDPMFEDQLQPFIEWKKRKGFIVVEAYTDEIGTTKEEIKAFLQDLYDNGTPEDPAPSFALFVGDVAQIPAYENGNGETDRLYFEYSGDLFPEVFYGRFSAQNEAQLQPYIDKTLQYEQFTMPDPSFLEEVVMIAGADSGHGHDWGNGQINYGTINYFNEDHDILSHTYLYPESGGSSAQIRQDISNGVAFA
ncbi:MAG: Gingipain R, partial [Bacteroidetes bacterium]